MSRLTPSEIEAALDRIEALDAEAAAIRRRVALNGEDLQAEWDKLNLERFSLEKELWGDVFKGQMPLD